MRRDITQQLSAWRNSPRRSPLVLCGARQVGKTYTLREFGRMHYENCAYVNLMDDQSKELFDPKYDARQVLENIEVYTETAIRPGQTLIIVDEIQEAPHALTLMKAFKEELPEYHIASAGSYLGIAYHAGQSFPVGKVDMIDMHPMTFIEFLRANGEDRLAGWIEQLDFERLAPFNSRIERYLRQYYVIGGMPSAVSAFLHGDREHDYQTARAVQHSLLTAYDADFSKHAGRGVDSERVRLAFRSIPTHLGRENHKFIFGHIAKGARSAQYDTAIQFIVDSGLATRVYRLDKIALPLRAYEDLSSFKLYMADVGLLGAAMDVDARDLLLSNAGMEEYKGAMTEQYVCQQLVAQGRNPYYWSASNASAEIDFVLKYDGRAAPLEVKAEENVHAKSLRQVCAKTGLHGYRSSMRGYREQDWLTNIPLWAVGSYFSPTNDPASKPITDEQLN